MTPTAVGMVLVEGHGGEGEIMDQTAFDVPTRRGATAISTSEYVAGAMARRASQDFDGVIVSDWEDIRKLVGMHHVAANEKEATRLAILAGIDMSMVPTDFSFSDLLLQLVNERSVPITRIDDAVRRILVMKVRLGLFAEPPRGISDGAQVGSRTSL